MSAVRCVKLSSAVGTRYCAEQWGRVGDGDGSPRHREGTADGGIPRRLRDRELRERASCVEDAKRLTGGHHPNVEQPSTTVGDRTNGAERCRARDGEGAGERSRAPARNRQIRGAVRAE